MLRRFTLTAPLASSPSLAMLLRGGLRGAALVRPFHTSAVMRNSNAHNSGNSNTTGSSGSSAPRSAADEDKEELERERHLREKFAEKIQQGLPPQQQQQQMGGFGGGGFGGGPGWGSGNGAPFGGAAPVNPELAQRLFRFFFYFTALVFLVVMAPLANQNSAIYTLQGLAWWELPIASAADYLLLRSLYSRREQNRIKTEFENAARANATLTFDQFITQNYPAMFQGYRTAQPEMVAAVSACLSSAKDLRFAQTMVRAAGRAKDPRASTDDIMDALRRDFPQLF